MKNILAALFIVIIIILAAWYLINRNNPAPAPANQSSPAADQAPALAPSGSGY